MGRVNKKFLVCFLLACIAFSSISHSASKQSTTTSKEQLYLLKSGIERIIKSVDPHANLGIEIVSLQNNQVLYQKNASNMFVPASSLKVFTGAAAIQIL